MYATATMPSGLEMPKPRSLSDGKRKKHIGEGDEPDGLDRQDPEHEVSHGRGETPSPSTGEGWGEGDGCWLPN